MAKTTKVTLTFKASGDGLEHNYVFTSTNTNGPQSLELTTVQGFNGPWASGLFGDNMTGVVAVPANSNSGGQPSTSSVTKTLKGVTGDTGLSLDPGSVFVLLTPQGGGGFGLTYGSPEELFLIFI